ncbi:hypothetical protein Bca4012_064783 [Brassica carinata]
MDKNIKQELRKTEDFGCYNCNRLIDDKLKYIVQDQLKENEKLEGTITDDQRGVYNQILDAVLNDSVVFFLYGYMLHFQE